MLCGSLSGRESGGKWIHITTITVNQLYPNIKEKSLKFAGWRESAQMI